MKITLTHKQLDQAVQDYINNCLNASIPEVDNIQYINDDGELTAVVEVSV